MSLVGCQVKEIKPRLYFETFKPDKMFNAAVSSGNSSLSFSMFTEKCNKSATLALSSVYGGTNFAFSNSLHYNMSIYMGGLSSILYSASITPNGVLLLGSNGLEFSNDSVARSFNLNGNPEKSSFVDYCSSANNGSDWIFSVVAAFSSQSLHLSLDGGYNFVKEITISQLSIQSSNLGGFIRDVAIQPSFKNLAVLIRDSSGFDRIVIYDLEFNRIRNGFNFTLNAIDGGILHSDPGLLAFPTGEILAYGDNLFYRYTSENLLLLVLMEALVFSL